MKNPLLILISLLATSLVAQAGEIKAAAIEVYVPVAVDEGEIQRQNELMAKAEQCLKDAFRAGGAGWDFKLNIQGVKTLPTDIQWPEERGGYPRRKGQAFTTPGWNSAEASIYFYNVNEFPGQAPSLLRSHGYVPLHPFSGSKKDSDILDLMSKIFYAQAEINLLSQTDSSPDLSKKAARLNQAYISVSGDLSGPVTNAAQIFIDWQQREGKGTPIERVVAHEFLHSWGGLEDRYNQKPKEGANPLNMMNADIECVLTSDQIAAIEKYRASGKKETLEP